MIERVFKKSRFDFDENKKYKSGSEVHSTIFIWLFSLGTLFNCDPSTMENICDTNSGSFSKTMAAKSILGDNSAHCTVSTKSGTSGFTIGGKVLGLTGSGLRLILNKETLLSLPAGSAEFSFPDKIPIGTDYEVNFVRQAQGNFCELVNPIGKISNKDIKEIEIHCYPSCNNCIVYITQNSYPANIGKASNFDSYCQSDPNYPGTGRFKVMVVDGESRRASNTTNLGDKQIDWVFKANQSYVRDNGIGIETANANGLFTGISTPITALTSDHWTGLNPDWTTSANGTCKKWTTNSPTESGIVGDAYTQDVVTLTAGKGSQLCSVNHELVCVEQ
ncbi:DUF1554 domain-containing protein [Leptospira perdikensis]|uniref:DUF1554 domain-containing protein n=1 Tax=Leptospira perdikensis TaxID=2484948 RepID=A0A4R9JJY4_9LEPT|nr:DUF1554 domain-containing protein [Leptospira perdikensis]TGL45638.1 DUF1554 domain-containing protein [Leptospira perdikensis]